ncbi:MAG: IPTL-CTERM sorting domain-containing protein [Candidatus Thiodiazotropha sp. (ex Dulcina madagascariensis)]|nr:IPTL-CTERM sorting domain-containing protein [Candidatus Thiodiazotropha sp. (ex Dulcina madagascariensis)]
MTYMLQKQFTRAHYRSGLLFVLTLQFLPAGTLLAVDWGDAPDPTYPTLAASTGAQHVTGGGLFFGAAVDDEADGQPTAAADGDDLAGIDDEDGIVFATAVTQGSAATINITASGAGLVDAWIDYNGDGDWLDAGEQILTNQAVVGGLNAIVTAVPVGASPGASFARFRISTAGGLAPTGASADGEVEDYQVTISAAPPPAQQIPALSSIGLVLLSLLLGGLGFGRMRKKG